MALFADLDAKLDKVLAEVKAHNEADATVVADRDAKIAALTAERDALKAQLDNSTNLTPEQVESITVKLQAIDDLLPDVEPTPEPTA